ncbi:asparagine synthase-related protein [Halopiger goleimassiliensis]|uniref:asparagine synthase-related protein n=1 Tax=Halopiger goleimassiliensis TaxID=1293048 RepID=UPI0006781FD9|nr:asparagine synthase-related protein [Halopiger goleimassiliensis]
MPGVTVVAGPERPRSSTLESAHRPCHYDDRYAYRTYDGASSALVTARYPAYPFERIEFESAETTVTVEGVVYNRDTDTLRTEIERHLVGGIDVEDVSEWLAELDGEFVFYVRDDARNELTIVPDLLGQLPLFYATETPGYAVVGRNKFVLSRLVDSPALDRLSVAQYLRIGYTLTGRTLFEDVRRVPDGTIVRIDADTGTLELERHHQFDFSTESNEERSVESNARTLAKRFTAAARRRAASCPGTNALLLSGGLDSRGVMGAFERANVEYVAATRDFEHDSRADIEVAEELAAAVDADWKRIDTPAPTGADLLDHLDMTAGTDPFNIAHIQPFLRRVRSHAGESVWMYTGDGGDKLLPDLSPRVELETRSDLVDYILRTESQYDAADVEAMTGVPDAEIRSAVRSQLEGYPESTLTKQYLHFELFERGFSWLFEATDTNRNHSWTTSPYYALDVLEYAMNCPDEQKRRYRLFTAFLEELSPELTRIRNANVGAAPASRSHTVRYSVHDVLLRYPRVLDRVLPLVKRMLGTKTDSDPSPAMISCIREQLEQNSSTAIDLEGTKATLLENPTSYSRYNLCLAFTLLSVLDQWSGTDVLEDYRNVEFG